MRSDGIEIQINKGLIPQEILDSGVLDIEYSSKEGYDILWIHDDGYKPFLHEYFQYLNAGLSAYNRKTKTDHLELFIETEEELDEYGVEIDGIKYENITFSNVGVADLSKAKFKRELK